MFDNKTLKVQSTGETLFPRLKCVRARVCVCVRVRGALQNRQAKYTLSFGRPNDQIHTKHVKTDGLESIHLKHSLYLKVNENSWEKIVCQYSQLLIWIK